MFKSRVLSVPISAAFVVLTVGLWEIHMSDIFHLHVFGQISPIGSTQHWGELVVLFLIAMVAAHFIVRKANPTSNDNSVLSFNPAEIQDDRFKRWQEAGEIGCWEYTVRSEKIWWSDEVYHLLGFEPGELEPDFELVLSLAHPEDRDKLRKATFDSVFQKKNYKLEYRIARKDGIEIILRVSGIIFCDANDEVECIGGTIQDVTDLVRADQELKRSEYLLAEAERIAHLGSWEYDAICKKLWWSDETFRVMGYTPGSFNPTNKKWNELFHPEDREYAAAEANKCLNEKTPLNYEHRIIRPDGSVRYVRKQGDVFVDEQGNLTHVTGTVLDITDQKRIELDLQKARDEMEDRVLERTAQVKRQAEIINQFNDAVISTDPHGHIDSWNKGAERLFGYSTTDAMGMDYTVLYEGAMHADRSHEITRELDRSGSIRFDTDMKRQDGTLFAGHMSLSKARNQDGTPAGIIGYIQDITERKNAERALAESESMLRNLTNLSPVGIFHATPDGVISYANESCGALVGRRGKDIVGDHWIDFVHPDDKQKTAEKWQHFVSSDDPFENELRVVRPDNSIGWVNCQAIQEYDKAGKLSGYVGTAMDITERKFAEEALVEGEERFRAITENSSDITVIIDEDGCYSYVSPATMRTLGYSREDFLGSKPIKFIHPDDQAMSDRMIEKATLNPGRTFRIPELKVVTVNGIILNFEILFSYLPDTDGIHGLVANARDITERVGMEKRLRDRETRLESLAQLAPCGMFHSDANGMFNYTNHRWSEIFGLTQENAHYQGWASVLNSEDRERVLAKWRRTVTLRLAYKDEFRISKPNGETAWVFVQASPELDENGQILGYAGMALDISERILAEREITDARNRIDEKQRQLECAVESFSDGFMLFDADDRIVICNESCRQDLMPIAEYLEPGQRFKDFARAMFDSDEIIPEDYRTEENFQRRLDNHRNPEAGPWSAPVKDGRWMMVQEYRTRDGGIALIRSDISKQVETQRSVSAKSAFMSRMSNDLRTPLNAILGFGQLLDRDKSTPMTSVQKEFVSEILKAGYVMLDLVNDVLDLEKIESGKLSLDIRESPLGPLLVRCMNMISADAESCKVELVTEYDLKDLPSLRVDETRFQQVLLNLLSNAIKYNIPDGRVVLNCKTMAGGMVRISVSDTGRGIPADQKDRVFEAFKRLDADNSDTPGNGIGLSIARQLTESMGGVLGFESTVDVGSTFWVELPSANRMLH